MSISRRKVLQTTLGLAASSTFASWPRMVFAAPQKWELSDEYQETGLTGQACLNFIKEVDKRVGGELEITYAGSGVLGFKSVDHFDAVENGAVSSAFTLVTQLGGIDPLFDMSSLPFLVPNLKEARRLWHIAKPEYEKIFDAHNMVLLWAMPNAPSGIHAKRAITTPEALDGLRIRTYDVNGTKTLKTAGASPLQIAWADLIPQLSTGGIDAVLTSADGGVHLSIWDYLSDFTALDYAMALQVAHVNKDAYMSLSKDARTAIQEASAAAEDFNWQNVTASIQKSYDIMRSHDMTVTESAPAAVFERVNAAAGEVRDKWLAKVGDRGKRIFDQL